MEGERAAVGRRLGRAVGDASEADVQVVGDDERVAEDGGLGQGLVVFGDGVGVALAVDVEVDAGEVERDVGDRGEAVQRGAQRTAVVELGTERELVVGLRRDRRRAGELVDQRVDVDAAERLQRTLERVQRGERVLDGLEEREVEAVPGGVEDVDRLADAADRDVDRSGARSGLRRLRAGRDRQVGGLELGRVGREMDAEADARLLDRDGKRAAAQRVDPRDALGLSRRSARAVAPWRG